MKCVIFAGPTISEAEAKRYLDAIYLPPVKEGDIINALLKYEPDIIGIIDGASYPELEVWHREILYAVENGVSVYGSSSIGAIRAVEMGAHGMIGVGEVYKYLQSLTISDDDEVMCEYDYYNGEYLRRSEPFINIKATLEAARQNNVIDDKEYDHLVKSAKSFYYRERSIEKSIEKCRELQLISAGNLEDLKVFAKHSYIDIQKEDAILLLQSIKAAQVISSEAKNSRIVDEADSLVFHVLKYRDRDIERDGIKAPLFSVADYIILNHPESDEIGTRAKNRFIAQILADIFHITPSEDDIKEQERIFRNRFNLGDEKSFSEWLLRNDLVIQEFKRLMISNAKMHSLHRWLRTRLGQRKFTRIILDELMLTDQYSKWMDKAFLAEKIADEKREEFKDLYQNETVENLTAEHMRQSWRDWHRIFLNTMDDMELSGFALKLQLAKTRLEREALEKLLLKFLSSVNQISEK